MDLWTLCDLETPWCIHVASTLRLAHHMEAGVHEVEQLAVAAGAAPEAVERLLRHLVSKGIFTEPVPAASN